MTAQRRSTLAGLLAPLALGAALGGCSFAEEALWPSITNTRPMTQRQQQQVVVGQMAANVDVVPAPEETAFLPPPRTDDDDEALPAPGPEAQRLDDRLAAAQAGLEDRNRRLQNLRATGRDALQSFQTRAASIEKRLLASTGPNDETLQADWGRSRGDLDVLEEVVAQYEALNTENLAAASALAALGTEIRDAEESLGPAAAALAADSAATLAVVKDLGAALAQDDGALAAQAALARLDLEAMEAAIPGGAYVGDALARRAQGEPARAPADGAAKLVGRANPLAVIDFTDDSGVFEPALFSIVYAALARRPNAAFDLVGVSPSGTEETDDGAETDGGAVYTSRLDIGRSNAQRVRRALLSMGLPAERMTLDIASSPMAKAEEVHIYVR